MKVVFDANVAASASFWRGPPFDCLAAWAQGRCVAAVSSSLLALRQFKGIPIVNPTEFLRRLATS